MELKMVGDGPESARLDALETALGMVITRMRRDEANAIVSDLRNLAKSSRNDPEIALETIAAVDRLAGLLGQWARLPPPLREV
ncbi:hypothetical protein R1A27_28560 [Methylobacterium sp. NMS12]|uniref:hypothetical protein n=1 Tax=Methylobacterium sp. NMS12 TaxID=3079766 RepID=UPI003F885BC2